MAVPLRSGEAAKREPPRFTERGGFVLCRVPVRYRTGRSPSAARSHHGGIVDAERHYSSI